MVDTPSPPPAVDPITASTGQEIANVQGAVASTELANANVNTPNFRRSDVSFKEALAATEASQGDPDELALTTTSDRHFAVDGPQDPEPFSITTTVDSTTQMRVDGSNVDVDQEMAKLSLNSAYAQTMGQLLQNQYSRLRQAIQS